MNSFNLREKRIDIMRQLKSSGYTYYDIAVIFGAQRLSPVVEDLNRVFMPEQNYHEEE